MLLSDFDFDLPPSQIAQRPLAQRDASRMLMLDRKGQTWTDDSFSSFPEQLRGDELIVVNNVRVIPARLFGRRLGVLAEKLGHDPRTAREFLSSEIEVLLTRRVGASTSSGSDPKSKESSAQEWDALVRPGRKMRVGERVEFGNGELSAEVLSRGEYGLRRIKLTALGDVTQTIEKLGHIPLPPYITRDDEPADRERYQTVFADTTDDNAGAVAAPTAGLHFSPEILDKIRQRNIEMTAITLDVGLGTFQPIHEKEIEAHKIHSERYEISQSTATALCNAHRDGRPVLAVGTTVVRALEDAAAKAALKTVFKTKEGSEQFVQPGSSEANIFIKPGHQFRAVNQLVTNFHLPQSTLLVLVSAFAGREFILSAYRNAVEAGYRFYSYGDCMWIR